MPLIQAPARPDARPFTGTLLIALWFSLLLGACSRDSDSAPTAAQGASEAQAFYTDASDFMQQGKHKAAVLQLKNALKADPDHTQSRLMLGMLYLDLWAPSAAEKELLRASELGAERTDWIVGLGQAYLRMGRSRKIIDDIVTEENDPPALASQILTLRGEAYIQLRQLDIAATELSKADSQDPGQLALLLAHTRLALKSGRPREAIDYMIDAGKIGKDSAEFWTVSGDLYLRLDQEDRALAAFSKAVELQPNFIQPRLAKAALLVNNRKANAATRELDSLKRLAPRLGQTHYLEAMVALQNRDLEKAQSALLRLLELNPRHVQGNLVLGTLYFDTSNYDLAVTHINIFYRQFPHNPEVAKLLAAAHLRLDDPTAAIDVLLPYLSDDKQDSALLAQLGTAYLKAGEPPKADRYLQSAVALAPDIAWYRFQLALAKLALGQQQSALEQLELAGELQPDLFRAELVLVLAQLKQGNFEDALTSALKLLEKHPEDPVTNGLVGNAYVGLGDSGKARKYFRAALKHDPQSTGALLSLATIDIQAGDVDSAENLYRRAQEADPSNFQAALKLAEIAERRGQPDAALEVLRQAYTHNPQEIQLALALASLHTRMQQPQKALDVASQLAIHHPYNTRVSTRLAETQITLGKLAPALETLNRLVRASPENTVHLTRLAQVQFMMGDTRSARENLLRARELGDNSPKLLMALGTVSLHESKISDALTISRDLQRDHPDNAHGYQLEGEARSEAGENALALQAYTRAYQIAPSAQLALLRTHSQLALNNNDGAIDSLREWLELHPDDQGMSVALANEYLRQEIPAKARAIYEELLDKGYRHPIVLNNLALIYLETNDTRSVAISREAYDADPQNPVVEDTYGWVLLHSGDTQRSLQLIRQAVYSVPTNNTFRYHLAVSLHRNGDDRAAKRELDRLFKSGKPFKDMDKATALAAMLDRGN